MTINPSFYNVVSVIGGTIWVCDQEVGLGVKRKTLWMRGFLCRGKCVILDSRTTLISNRGTLAGRWLPRRCRRLGLSAQEVSLVGEWVCSDPKRKL